MEQKDFQELVLQRLEYLEKLFTRESRPDDGWVKENAACQMFNLKPRTFRNKVRKGKIEANYRTESGRGYEYLLKDLIKHKKATSTL